MQVSNVQFPTMSTMRLDFLGKDAVHYERDIIDAPQAVFENMQEFVQGKSSGEKVFECISAKHVNARLHGLMPGLSARMFRTWNASRYLEQLLDQKFKQGATILELQDIYLEANIEVARLCNHKRTSSEKRQLALKTARSNVATLQRELAQPESNTER